MNDRELDALFATARAAPVDVSDVLLARILADAGVVTEARTAPARAKPGFWRVLWASVGGWPALSGMAAATLAGVWIGFAPPSAVETLATTVWGDTTTISLFSADDILEIEG